MIVFVVDHSNGRAIGFKSCAQKGASRLDSGAWDPTQENDVHPFGEAPVICKNLRAQGQVVPPVRDNLVRRRPLPCLRFSFS